MIDIVDEKLFVLVLDRPVENPLVEIVEVDLTARFQTLDEEAFDIVLKQRCVLIIEHSEKVRSGW